MSRSQYVVLKLLVVLGLNVLGTSQATEEASREVVFQIRNQNEECRFMLPENTARRLTTIAKQNSNSSSIISLVPLVEERSNSKPGTSLSPAPPLNKDRSSPSSPSTSYPTSTSYPPRPPITCVPCHPPVPVAVIYGNLDGVSRPPLRLDSDTILDIYSGKIRKWNDQAIQKLNPERQLPDMNIVVVHAESGCSTALFSDYLSQISSKWHDAVGAGINVNWPVAGLRARGGDGVLKTVRETPGSIGYLGSNIAPHDNVGTIELIPDPKYDILKSKWLEHP